MHKRYTTLPSPPVHLSLVFRENSSHHCLLIKPHLCAYIPLSPPSPSEYDTISSRVSNSTQQTAHLNHHPPSIFAWNILIHHQESEHAIDSIRYPFAHHTTPTLLTPSGFSSRLYYSHLSTSTSTTDTSSTFSTTSARQPPSTCLTQFPLSLSLYLSPSSWRLPGHSTTALAVTSRRREKHTALKPAA